MDITRALMYLMLGTPIQLAKWQQHNTTATVAQPLNALTM